MKTNRITLTNEERTELEKFSTTGTHNIRLVNRAKIILALDTSNNKKPLKHKEITKKLDTSRQTINNTIKRYHKTKTIPDFLQRKKRKNPPIEPKITGEIEAHIIAIACSQTPQGHAKWTLKLIADKCIELNYIDSISRMSVSRLLKKHNLLLT